MSPRSNRSGVSYEVVPEQRDDEQVPIEDDETGPADDAEEIEERSRPDYSGWTKAQLNEELDRRGIEHDPKANNAVLIEELERSDGGETVTGVND